MSGASFIDLLGDFVGVLIKVGVEEGPEIAAAIKAAVRGEDPLDAISKEHVDNILPGLKLELAMHAERLRFQNQVNPIPGT